MRFLIYSIDIWHPRWRNSALTASNSIICRRGEAHAEEHNSSTSLLHVLHRNFLFYDEPDYLYYNLQSTGQFIPLIIGIGGVLSVMLSLLGIYLEKSEYKPENDPNAPRETEEGTELRTLPSKQEPRQVQTTKLRTKLEGKKPASKPIQAKGSAPEV
ncbi:hypothetical protein NA56DRAFT_655017 [Hyaloscypha hepaticicola]|uniref:Uncharacterized protein n=1 Tax=Hyaloscypha hepaticicola TaxID=2082293 RepID=A0A2J6QJH6_9HELO|nr:hypothetical protein NA56DRAFT_655017 [Hyaloscypha hepaticicola]